GHDHAARRPRSRPQSARCCLPCDRSRRPVGKLMADSYLIGLNGLFLDHPRTGTGVYTREVLTRLVRISEPTSSRDATPSLKAGADALARPSGRVTLRYVVVGHPEHAAACAAVVPYVRLQAPLRRRSQNAEKVLWEQLALPLATA